MSRGITATDVEVLFEPPYMGMGAGGLSMALAETAERIGAVHAVEAVQVGDDAVRAVVLGDRAALAVHVAANPETGRLRSAVGAPCELSGVELGTEPAPGDDPIGWQHQHDQLGLVGSSFVVIRSGVTADVGHRGVASVRAMNEVTATTLFGWGSVTKPITALAALRLVDDGRLALDAPANNYLRQFRIVVPGGAPGVTVRDLLTHRTGVLDGGAVYDFDASPAPSLPHAYAPELTARSQPGERAVYDNHGFGVVGQIVEDVSGAPFPDAVRELVFDPVGATSARIGRFPFGQETDLHMLAAGKAWPLRPYAVIPQGAGAMVASTADIASVLVAVLHSSTTDGGLWKRATLDEMFSEQTAGRGLGTFISTRTGDRMAWHTGGGPGMTSIIAMLPDHAHAVAIVTNTHDDGDRPIHRAMERLAGSVLVQLRDG